MTIGDAAIARLASLSGVTALVSMRIYLQKIAQNVVGVKYPLIRVAQIDEMEPGHLRGSGGIQHGRLQVDIFAQEASGVNPYAQAHAVEQAVHGDGAGSGLAFFSGGIGSPPFEILGMVPVGRMEGYDPDELRLVRITREYMAHWRN